MSTEITFGDIAKLTDREIQMILREVDTRDLAVSMLGANEAVNERYFANVSNRIGNLLREEMAARGEMSASDTAEVQSRIVETILQLRDHGQIVWPKENEKPRPKGELGEGYVAAKERVKAQLAEKSYLDMNCEGITEAIVGLANVARAEGILELETLVDTASNDLLLTGIGLAVDGTEPELIQTILETRTEYLVLHCVTTCRMMMEGFMSIQCNDNPRIVEQKLRAFYVAPPSKRSLFEGVSIDDLKTQVQNTPHTLWMFDEVTDLMTDASIVARWQGVAALEPLVSLAKLKLLQLGLRLTVDEVELELTQNILETHLVHLEHHLMTKCRMVMEGIMSIQSGDHPNVVESKVRTFFDFD
jgi:flagellar motor component MotA